MSVRFPWTSATDAAALSFRLDLPASSSNQKVANLAYTTIFFFRTPPFNNQAGNVGPLPMSGNPVLLAKAGGNTGGGDGFINLTHQGTTLNCTIRRSAGVNIFPSSSITLELNKQYMGILIGNPSNRHLVVCEVGQSPLTPVTYAGSEMFVADLATNRAWASIGGASSATAGYYNTLEEVCMWTGVFPESAGVPDLTLIANLASGVQSLDGLHTLLDSGLGTVSNRKFRYRLRDETDLTNQWVAESLTEVNKDRAAGRVLHPSGPILPTLIMPSRARDFISQATFVTPGNASTATADVRIEGGSYTGLATMAKVQVRLLNEVTRAVIRDWIDMPTTAPLSGSGTWSGATFTSVPMTNAYMYAEFRALNGSDAVIAGPVPSYALRGVGFSLVAQAQSQLNQLTVLGNGVPLTLGTRAIVCLTDGNALIPADPNQPSENIKPATTPALGNYVLSSACSVNLGARLGIRALINEINAAHPGVPIQYTNMAVSGTSLPQFYGAGPISGRWSAVRDLFVVVQPFFQFHLGHSSPPSSGTTQFHLGELIAWTKANFGTALKYLHAPVPRYRDIGTSPNATFTANSRNGARAYVDANPSENLWMGSWSPVYTRIGTGAATGATTGPTDAEATSGSEPHSEYSLLQGQGRTGSFMGISVLMAARAIPDEPVGMVSSTPVNPTTVRLNFGRANLGTGAFLTPTPPPAPSGAWTAVGAFGQSGWAYTSQQGQSWDGSSIAKPVMPAGAENNYMWITNQASRTEGSDGPENAYEHFFVNNTTLAADSVSAAWAATAVALHRIAPGVRFALVDLAKPGAAFTQLKTDNLPTATRTWNEFAGQINYARNLVGEIDAVIVYGWTDLRQNESNFIMGENWNGTPATIVAPTTPGNAGALNHILWDVTAPVDQVGRGIFARSTTKLIQQSGTRATTMAEKLEHAAFSADPRVQTFALKNYINMPLGAQVGGHALNTEADGSVYTHFGFVGAYLRAAGIAFDEPEIMWNEVTIGPSGSYADIPVTLPSGGNLTTIRALEGRADPVPRGIPATMPYDYQPVIGFEVLRAGDPDTLRLAVVPTSSTDYATKYRGTVVVHNNGAGSGSARRGTIRITPLVPFATGDRLFYHPDSIRLVETNGHTEDERVAFDKVWLNYMLETVPAYRNLTDTYPFPGFAVRPQAVSVALELGDQLVPINAGSAMIAGTTPVLAGIQTGEYVMMIIGAQGNNPAPVIPAGWTPVTITGAGPDGATAQVRFRVAWREWVDGDTLPVVTNAQYVDVHRLPNGFRPASAVSVFGNATNVLQAPEITPLASGGGIEQHRHFIHYASRSGSLATDSAVAGFTRASTLTNQRSTYFKPGTVTSIPAVTMPAIGTTNGGGVLTIQVYKA